MLLNKERKNAIEHQCIALELSCDESRTDSALSVVQHPACRNSLLSQSSKDIHNLVHSKLYESVEFHSELVLMTTTTKDCHLNCLFCCVSGFRELVVRLVQVSSVSCFSHDAVRSVTKSQGSSLRIVLPSHCLFFPNDVLGVCL